MENAECYIYLIPSRIIKNVFFQEFITIAKFLIPPSKCHKDPLQLLKKTKENFYQKSKTNQNKIFCL